MNVTSLKWSPQITFDDFRDPLLHAFIFQANLSGPPSESFQSFSDPPFCSPKNQVIPPKILRSPRPPDDK